MTRKSGITIIYQYLIILIILHMQNVCSDWLIQCGSCRCKWISGKKSADCTNLTLRHVPMDLNTELQALDLSFNDIKKVDDNTFITTKLENLHKLLLRNCLLEHLNLFSFKGLNILTELDISNNLIKQLPRDVFNSLENVRSILINNNLLEILDNTAIRNLRNLRKIELKGNRIAIVNGNAFQNIPHLSHIFLNGNQLSFLRKEPFEKLKKLVSLALHSNPWNCTCDLQIFRDFTLEHNLYTTPISCYNPVSLRGILWNDELSESFACKPKIFYPPKGALIKTSKANTTLMCKVNGTPNTVITWYYNKQIYDGMTYHPRIYIQLLRKGDSNLKKKYVRQDIYTSRLTIFGVRKFDEGIYTCLAENIGGKDEVQMRLLVHKHSFQNLIVPVDCITIVSLIILELIFASTSFAVFTFCIYKGFKYKYHNKDSFQNKNSFRKLKSPFFEINAEDLNNLHRFKFINQHKCNQQENKNSQPSKKNKNDILNGNSVIIDSRISRLNYPHIGN